MFAKLSQIGFAEDELNPDDLCSLPYYGSICEYPVYDMDICPTLATDRFIFEKPKESLLKRLFSFLFR